MLADLRLAFVFLTVLPLGRDTDVYDKPGRALAFFPLVGLALGVCLFTLSLLPLPPDWRALLLLLAWVGLTGGLHLDGFGDSCDAMFAAVSPARRLEILKDPRAGTWAVLGLVLLLMAKFLALHDLGASPLLLIVPLWARWVMLLMMLAFPSARPDGLGASFRVGFGVAQFSIALLLALLPVLALIMFYGPQLMLPLIAVFFLCWMLARWMAGRLGGGLTGDSYGALCEVAELFILIALVALYGI